MRTLNNNYKVDENKLIEYGFIKENNIYTYNKYILDNEFKIIVEYKDNIMTSKLIEVSFNDEYLQADSNSTGEYSNNIKTEYEKVLNNIKKNCQKKEVFKSTQTQEVINYIHNKYDCELEYLWEKYDNNAIVRNSLNNKWFGVFMKISPKKIGLKKEEDIEMIDLQYYKDKVDDIIDFKSIFPGYHMNKKSWVTIVLDNEMNIEDIFKLIDISYTLSISKK